MNEMLKNVEPLFADMDVLLKQFKKATYEEAFSKYRENNQSFFEEVDRMLAAGDENTGFIDDFAENVSAYAADILEKISNRIEKENMRINFNMFMAVYFMPAILEGKQTQAKELTAAICVSWSKRFKDSNIKSASHADIVSGFRSKMCYVTTAVCRSLNKEDDCYELELLRNYRDFCLMKTVQGEALVRRYYDIAPTIVKRIDKCTDADAKYLYIWANYLKPCISYIENGEEEACGRTYIRMVEELERQYMNTAEEHKMRSENKENKENKI